MKLQPLDPALRPAERARRLFLAVLAAQTWPADVSTVSVELKRGCRLLPPRPNARIRRTAPAQFWQLDLVVTNTDLERKRLSLAPEGKADVDHAPAIQLPAGERFLPRLRAAAEATWAARIFCIEPIEFRGRSQLSAHELLELASLVERLDREGVTFVPEPGQGDRRRTPPSPVWPASRLP